MAKLTAKPGTIDFYRQLLEIAWQSDHLMDRALVPILVRRIENRLRSLENLIAIATDVWEAWNDERYCSENRSLC